MSYDVSLTIDTGGREPHTVADFNHTSNTFAMFAVAFSQKDGIKTVDRRIASEAEFLINVAIGVMDADPAFFRAMNPANGWGDSLTAYQFLCKIRDACKLHPLTRVRVSS